MEEYETLLAVVVIFRMPHGQRRSGGLAGMYQRRPNVSTEKTRFMAHLTAVAVHANLPATCVYDVPFSASDLGELHDRCEMQLCRMLMHVFGTSHEAPTSSLGNPKILRVNLEIIQRTEGK